MSPLKQFFVFVVVLTMTEYFHNSAVLAEEREDPEALALMEKSLKPKTWARVYAQPIAGTETADTSAVYRCVKDSSDPRETQLVECGVPSFPSIQTLYGMLKFAAETYGPRPYIGERVPIKDENGAVIGLSNFKFYTFTEALRLVEALGRALDFIVKVPVSTFPEEENVAPMRVVGVWARSRMDWRFVDFATNYRGIVNVPLYDTLGEESLRYIVERTKMEVIACEGSKVESALRLHKSGLRLRAVISFDELTEEQKRSYEEEGVSLFYQADLCSQGAELKETADLSALPTGSDDISTIIYTSGTTGTPKGAVHTNRSLVSMVGSYLGGDNRMRISPGDVTLSYLPLAHIYQRGVELVVTVLGVRLAYYSGNLMNLQEDLQLLKPTVFIGVPRVFTRVLGKIKAGIAEKPFILQWLVGKALASKKAKYKSNPGSVSSFFPDLLFYKVRSTFGGRLKSLSMGSAPMDRDQVTDLQMYLSAAVCEGWGMTETGIAFLQDASDGEKGSIGGPLAAVEYKVESVAALNYDAHGDPPKGELLVRGPSLMREYFRNPEQTAATFTPDRWMRTGDVVEVQPNGAVKIIDRAKNIFKIAQGEYIAPERLENIYINSPFVDQIFVHGDSLQAALVAVVVANEAEVLHWAKANGKQNVPLDELLSDESLVKTVLNDLEKLGRASLKGFELIRALKLVREPFSVENGLATPTMKVIRPKAKDHYARDIQQMYKEIADRERISVP